VINKSKSAFRTIAEVADEIGVATHVLRFWETKFSQIKPMKMSGKRRYYRPEDVEIIKLIRNLLYENRYTIEGAQRLIKEKGLKNLLGEGAEIQKDFFAEEEPDLPLGLEPIAKEIEKPEIPLEIINADVLENIAEAVDDLKEIRDRLYALKSGF
jgi:DNA-binding transcriptional MerR regulator